MTETKKLILPDGLEHERKLESLRRMVNMAILRSDDGGKNWTPLMPDEIPDAIQTDESISAMANGMYCEMEEPEVIGSLEMKKIYYCGVEIPENAH